MNNNIEQLNKEIYNKLYNNYKKDNIEINLEQLGKEDTKLGTTARLDVIFYKSLFLQELIQQDIFLEIYDKLEGKYTKTILKKIKENQYEIYKTNNKDGINKEDNDDILFPTSLYINKEFIAEQIQQENYCKFQIYNFKTKETKQVNDFYVDGLKHIPIYAEETQHKYIKLPSGIEEYNTDEELDEDIKKFINKWLDVNDEFLQYSVWNIKRSWVYDKFHSLNYLRALGDTGQGKSRFLDTLGSLHYKPIATSGATTTAPIFRIIQKWKGTLIIDEADLKKSDESEEFIKIINLGFEKDKPIMRCDPNDSSKINFFDPYCPKIIATRKSFTDKATESRCYTYVMKGTNRTDIPVSITNEFYKESMILRNKLLLWRFRNYEKINENLNIKDEEFELSFQEIEPRLRQISMSLLPLFYHNKKQLNMFLGYIKEKQHEIIEERANSFDGEVVLAFMSLYDSGEINISNSDIIEKAGFTDFKGNVMKPRGLTKYLKALGFKTNERKRIGEIIKRCIPIDKKLIRNLRKRYIIKNCDDVDDCDGYIGHLQKNKINIVIDDKPKLHDFDKNIEKDVSDGGGRQPIGQSQSSTSSQEIYEEILIKSDDEILIDFIKNQQEKEIDIKFLLKKGFKEELIKDMLKKGDLYEPRKGFILKI